MAQKIENILPNINMGAFENDYNAFIQMIETYLGLYVMTCIPVIVEKFKNGIVSLKPVLRRTNSTGEEIDITDNDIIYNVPMLKIMANGWKFNFNAKKGDFGLLICSKYDITNYKKEHTESVVGSRRMFNISDGFFLPMDWSGDNQEGFVISKGTTELKLEENKVTIAGDTVNINATTANIEAISVNLGTAGGQGVARIGDSVDLETGLITSGSLIVKAG